VSGHCGEGRIIYRLTQYVREVQPTTNCGTVPIAQGQCTTAKKYPFRSCNSRTFDRSPSADGNALRSTPQTTCQMRKQVIRVACSEARLGLATSVWIGFLRSSCWMGIPRPTSLRKLAVEDKEVCKGCVKPPPLAERSRKTQRHQIAEATSASGPHLLVVRYM
jgi:hypothetical protein